MNLNFRSATSHWPTSPKRVGWYQVYKDARELSPAYDQKLAEFDLST